MKKKVDKRVCKSECTACSKMTPKVYKKCPQKMTSYQEIKCLEFIIAERDERLADLGLEYVYMRFDLEATQRENCFLRKRLKEEE